MKIICDRQSLADGLSIATKAIGGKATTMSVLECVYLSADERGLYMLGSDLQLAIEVRDIPCELIEGGSVSLPARLFTDIIHKLPQGNITVSSDERNVTLIQSGKSQFKILALSGEDYPMPSAVSRETVNFVPSFELREMIKETLFAVGVEETRQALNGELMEFGASLSLTALDGLRVANTEIKLEPAQADQRVIIPAKALSELGKILPSDKESAVDIYISDKHAMFTFKNISITTRLIEGSFIDFRRFFDVEPTTVCTVDRLYFSDTLERSMLVSSDARKTPVKLSIEDGVIAVSSNAENGTFYDEVTVDHDGAALEIGFNPRFLLDALKVIAEDKAILEFTSPLRQVVIRAEGNERYKFFVMPLRLKS